MKTVRNIEYADGKAFTFVHGTHSGCASVCGKELTRGSVRQHDASSGLSLPVFKGFRVVVTAMWHKCALAMLPHQRERLVALGFPYAEHARTPALGVVDVYDDNFVPDAITNRTCIELCCDVDSKIGSDTHSALACRKVRFTIRHDLTSESGVQLAMDAVTTAQLAHPGHLLVWISVPCTGGCPWHHVNGRYASAQKKIQEDKILFEKLWENCAKIAEYAMRSGGAMIAVEWPRQCSYWNHPSVTQFLHRHGFVRHHYNGCMYGLTSENPTTHGMPLKKSWTIASNTRHLGQHLNMCCDGTHKHAIVKGRDAKLSEGYTHAMVTQIHNSFHEFCQERVERAVPCGVFHPDSTMQYTTPFLPIDVSLPLPFGSDLQPPPLTLSAAAAPPYAYAQQVSYAEMPAKRVFTAFDATQPGKAMGSPPPGKASGGTPAKSSQGPTSPSYAAAAKGKVTQQRRLHQIPVEPNLHELRQMEAFPARYGLDDTQPAHAERMEALRIAVARDGPTPMTHAVSLSSGSTPASVTSLTPPLRPAAPPIPGGAGQSSTHGATLAPYAPVTVDRSVQRRSGVAPATQRQGGRVACLWVPGYADQQHLGGLALLRLQLL